MFAILGITFPIYAALGLGYFLVWKGVFRQQDIKSLGAFVFNVALPGLIFTTLAQRDPVEVFQAAYVLPYLIGGLLNIAVCFVLFSLRGFDPMRRAVGIMGSTCPNNGFVGYPVMLLAFPEIAGVVLTLNLVVETLILIPICLMLMEAASADSAQPLGYRLRRILWNVLKMPTMMALMTGLAIAVLHLPIPAPVFRFTDMVAASAGAVSLVVIGGSLAGLPLRGNKSLAALATLGKLVIHPAIVALVAAGFAVTGLLDISPDIRTALILSAAMPMFATYTIFAQAKGHEGAASLASLSATILAYFTLNGLLWLLT
ncbi:AEC family transporter [Tritonibacter horizontis]|uniref:Membrane transport protein n=1 Tax=Tritonibacter horizontis TaxID=1768241 RepID=A0A132C361_9RHOB|nr:AEC family transporter [Tritonibacter horizontis]KUP94956.1 membrane transport protein [Tritonibacter horizontis]